MPLPHLPPPPADFRARLHALPQDPAEAWAALVALAATDLSFLQTNALDAAAQQAFPTPPPGAAAPPVRLAVLGSATLTHLLPAIRVAGLRRGVWIDTTGSDFGQYLQELSDPGAGLAAFEPDGGAAGAGCAPPRRRRLRRARCRTRPRRRWTRCAGGSQSLAPRARRVPLPDHPADRAAGAPAGARQQRTPAAGLARQLRGTAERGAAADGGRGRRRSAGDR